MAKIVAGTDVASLTVKALLEITEGIGKVDALVGEIASASGEQARSVTEISAGIGQIDGVTQQNTASAEETASAAQELSRHAEELRELLSRFQLKG